MNPNDYYFQYTVDPSADEPIMLIDRHIGYDEEDGFGIMGDSFQRELLVLDSMGKKRIQVWINSPGGLVSDGYNIYNALLKTNTKVDTYCIGMAASIAGVIFQAGRKRIMNDYGILMYHNPFGGSNDKGLDAIKESIVQMICSRSGMDTEACTKMMARTTFISADEALTMKLCDEIDESVDFNKKRALTSTDEARDFYREIKNSLNNSFIKQEDMKSIANKLRLNPEASEAGILHEIDTMQNKMSDQDKTIVAKEAAIKDEQAKTAEVQKELDKVKNEFDAFKKDLEKKESDAKKAAEDKLELDVTNYLKAAEKDGKIKADDEDGMKFWKNSMKADFEAGKKAFEKATGKAETKLNKTANTLTTEVTDIDKKKLTNVIANKMASLKAAGK